MASSCVDGDDDDDDDFLHLRGTEVTFSVAASSDAEPKQ